MFTAAVLIATALHGPVETRPLQAPAGTGLQPTTGAMTERSAAAARPSEETRRKVFAELSACRTNVLKKADEQYPELSLQSRGYSAKEDVKRFRDRSRFENAGAAACERQIIEKHTIDRAQLFAITAEGVCQQWTPLAGKPRC